MLSDSAAQLLRELQGVTWIPTYNVCAPSRLARHVSHSVPCPDRGVPADHPGVRATVQSSLVKDVEDAIKELHTMIDKTLEEYGQREELDEEEAEAGRDAHNMQLLTL